MGNVIYAKIECMLFVAGDPVPLAELARVLSLSLQEIKQVLWEMERDYRADARGILPLVTDETVQLTSNRTYTDAVVDLVQPEEKRCVSQSLLETLAVIAYRQPVTRADIENIRGVRCEYAVSQLLKLGLVQAVGRKEVIGRPVLLGTTDKFLRQFGIHSVSEMPEYLKHSIPPTAEELTV